MKHGVHAGGDVALSREIRTCVQFDCQSAHHCIITLGALYCNLVTRASVNEESSILARPCNVFVVLRRVRNSLTIIIIIILIWCWPDGWKRDALAPLPWFRSVS